MRKRKMYLSVEDVAEVFGISVSFAYRVVERMNADLANKNYYVILDVYKRQAPYDDQKVRDAVNYAIDRQLIIDTIASGSGEPADAIIAPAVFGYFSPCLLSTYRCV